MESELEQEKEKFMPYPCQNWLGRAYLLINDREVSVLEISDHVWKKPGREKITPELIQRLVQKLEIEGPFIPEGRKDDKEFFRYEPAWDQGKSYKLVWYLQDNNNFLWVKTCHRTKKNYSK